MMLPYEVNSHQIELYDSVLEQHHKKYYQQRIEFLHPYQHPNPYLDSIKKNGSDDKQSENEGDDNDYIKKNKIFFAYEAQITLLAHAN